MSKAYKHVFFDLDDTLWDLKSGSAITLTQMYAHFNLLDFGIQSAEKFVEVYKPINNDYWVEYRENRITKQELRIGRYADTLAAFGIKDLALADKLNHYYVDTCIENTTTFSDAIEVLDYLKPKYHLHVITNGFLEVQDKKLAKSGFGKYFENIVVSETVGCMKPNPKVFDYALGLAKATPEESIMIGDSYGSDIQGAINANVDQVWLTNEATKQPSTYIINCLRDLKKIL